PEYIVIQPVDPGVYYVPVYDPYVVYGPWAWPAYRPFYWYPPGYVVGAAVIGFGVGFVVGSALWAHYNWGWHGGLGGGGTGPLRCKQLQWIQSEQFGGWTEPLAIRCRAPRHGWIPERSAAPAIPIRAGSVPRFGAGLTGPIPHPEHPGSIPHPGESR